MIVGNQASNVGTKVGLGGGVFGGGGSPTLINCTIAANQATGYGGGVGCSVGNAMLIGCLVRDNIAYDGGGGVYCSGGGTSPTLLNCTIAWNRADDDGGGLLCWSNSPTLTNCIVGGNAAARGPEIALRAGAYDGSVLDIAYSAVEGGEAGVYVDPDGILNWGPGNIDADALLTPNGHLTANSPCIDAGDDTALPVDEFRSGWRWRVR